MESYAYLYDASTRSCSNATAVLIHLVTTLKRGDSSVLSTYKIWLIVPSHSYRDPLSIIRFCAYCFEKIWMRTLGNTIFYDSLLKIIVCDNRCSKLILLD